MLLPLRDIRKRRTVLCVWMPFTGLHGDRTMNAHRAQQPTTLGQNPLCTETNRDELPTGIPDTPKPLRHVLQHQHDFNIYLRINCQHYKYIINSQFYKYTVN